MAFVSTFAAVRGDTNNTNPVLSSSLCSTSFITTLRRARHHHGVATPLRLSRRLAGPPAPRHVFPSMTDTLDDVKGDSNSTPQATPSSSSSASVQTPGPTTPDQITLEYGEEPVREVILDENIVGFCSIDPNTGRRLELSLREKEALFIDSVQSFFRGDEKVLGDDEFDTLKEELTWQGSDVVTLSRDEFKFLDAARAYEQGKPIMDDIEFDKLKKKLFEQGSIVAIQRGPRCSVQRQVTFSDIIPDKKRTLALYLPAGVFIGLTWLSFAFEFTPLHRIDPVLSLIIGSPIIFLFAKFSTRLVVPNAEIMVGDCPSCGHRTHVLFGDVLNQKGFETEANVKCSKCKAELKVERESCRMILMKEGGS